MERYAGVNSLMHNPANNLSSPFRWDVNLIELGVHFDNNYAFIYNANLQDIIRNGENLEVATEVEDINQLGPNTLVLDFFQDNRSRFVSVLAEAMGPSFMVNLKSGHSFGVFFRGRAEVSGRRIPNSLSYYAFENVLEGEQFNLTPFQTTAMTWTEIGLNYAREFYTDQGTFGIGANVKFLSGYEAFYLENNSDFSITRFPNDSIAVNDLNLSYGFTTSSTDTESFNPQRNGGGLGLDIGAIWTIDEDEDDHLFRFGVSILDLGRISFNQNIENHNLLVNGTSGFDANDFSGVTTASSGTELVSELLLGDTIGSVNNDNFGIWLPTGLSVQADVKITPMVYANATLIQSIPMPGPALTRNNLLAISPRIEHRWFSLALPVALYNWQDFRIGTSVRLAFLTLGSDNLGSLIGSNSNFTGTDFYLALKVNPFQFNLGGGGGGKSRGRGGKNVRCYEF